MKNYFYTIIMIAFVFGCKSEPNEEKVEELTVYTHRHYESDQALLVKRINAQQLEDIVAARSTVN